jgi:ribA/ribD-fused uncharacterized protein
MAEDKKVDIATLNDREYEFFFASKSPFSQWHRCQFTDQHNVTYTSAEQFMMYRKAKLFGDIITAGKILATDNQKTIKELGRQVAGFNEARWVEMRETIVTEGNMLKFGQNKELATQLLATAPKHLVEASPWDTVWGIGMDAETARNTPAHLWRGTNLLGKCLDRVRNTLAFQKRMDSGVIG